MSSLLPRGHRLVALPLLLLAACGGSETPTDNTDAGMEVCPAGGRYLALSTGSSWTYQVTDANGTEVKTQTVGAMEDVGGAKAGITAFKLTTTKPNGMTVSWQEDTGTAVVRHREQDLSGTTQTDEIYQPHKLRIDEAAAHLVAGVTWDETYTETITEGVVTAPPVTKTETWEVVTAGEYVTVPAGTFCALRLRRTSSVGGGAGSDKTYWFARDVGKIKETGAGQTEELMSFSQ